MKIVVISDEILKNELLATVEKDIQSIVWLVHPSKISDADCYIDLLFDNSIERISILKEFSAKIIIVNAVNITLSSLPENFIRINGWPTFLSRNLIEASCKSDHLKDNVEAVFSQFNKTIEWTPDIIGFISARVISMLINEAYFTLEDEVTGKNEIDIAMKLGTKYPYGPFEWSQKIGLKNIYELLSKLSQDQSRYSPCELLKNEAVQA